MQEYEITKDELRDPQGIRFWPDIKGRDGCRLPFPWDSKLANQGFNSGDEKKLEKEILQLINNAQADTLYLNTRPKVKESVNKPSEDEE